MCFFGYEKFLLPFCVIAWTDAGTQKGFWISKQKYHCGLFMDTYNVGHTEETAILRIIFVVQFYIVLSEPSYANRVPPCLKNSSKSIRMFELSKIRSTYFFKYISPSIGLPNHYRCNLWDVFSITDTQQLHSNYKMTLHWNAFFIRNICLLSLFIYTLLLLFWCDNINL